MKHGIAITFIIALIASGAFAQEPEVTNVLAEQRPAPSMMVDVYYDVLDPNGGTMGIALFISFDGGLTFEGPMQAVYGDVGQGILSGVQRHIIWNACIDYPNVQNLAVIPRIEATTFAGFQGEERDFELGNTGVMVTMVWIEPGIFHMGAQGGEEDAYEREYPRHEVTISQGFWLGKYEVTQAQWEAVTGDHPFQFDGHPNRPAETVSWNDIKNEYLPTLNEHEIGNPWRLPTEAEWEYACRAGHDETRFWWGDDPGYTQLGDYAWYSGNSGNQTHDVGTRDPNPWGLYDMHGNVWEWCEDDWHDNYDGAPVNELPWIDNPRGASRVKRGGGWNYDARSCRSAYRSFNNPSSRSYYGIRLMRSGN